MFVQGERTLSLRRLVLVFMDTVGREKRREVEEMEEVEGM